jgi:acid phosphatase
MANEYFWNNTLLLLTFDENESYGIQNKMFSILTGGAVPQKMWGTVDNTFYSECFRYPPFTGSAIADWTGSG